MKRIIKLTEEQLINIVSKVIKEQSAPMGDANTFTAPANSSSQERIANIAKTLTANKGVLPRDYIVKYDINPIELQAAKSLIGQQQTTQYTQDQRNKNIVNIINSIDPETLLIKSSNPKLNGMTWRQYKDAFKIQDIDITNAKTYVSKTNPDGAAKLAAAENSSKPDPKVKYVPNEVVPLKFGQSGNNIKMIQASLGVKPDGLFYTNTDAAVKKYIPEYNRQTGVTQQIFDKILGVVAKRTPVSPVSMKDMQNTNNPDTTLSNKILGKNQFNS